MKGVRVISGRQPSASECVMRELDLRACTDYKPLCPSFFLGFSGGSVVKSSSGNAQDTGDAGSILGSGRSPGGGNGSPLQCSCLENPMDRGAWRATVHGVTKSRTQLSTRE